MNTASIVAEKVADTTEVVNGDIPFSYSHLSTAAIYVCVRMKNACILFFSREACATISTLPLARLSATSLATVRAVVSLRGEDTEKKANIFKGIQGRVARRLTRGNWAGTANRYATGTTGISYAPTNLPGYDGHDAYDHDIKLPGYLRLLV